MIPFGNFELVDAKMIMDLLINCWETTFSELDSFLDKIQLRSQFIEEFDTIT
jgi:hypothetical protein